MLPTTAVPLEGDGQLVLETVKPYLSSPAAQIALRGADLAQRQVEVMLVMQGQDGKDSLRRLRVTLRDDNAWSLIYPLIAQVRQQHGNAFICVTSAALGVVLNDDAAAQWIVEPPSTALVDPSDVLAVADLAPTDSTGLVKLDVRFDALLLYGAILPPNVRYIGIREQDGVLVALDGPESPGAPVIGRGSHADQHLYRLLEQAQRVMPNCGGLVIEVRTHTVYAATEAALLGCVVRQQRPVVQRNMLADVLVFIPNSVHTMASVGRAYARSDNPIGRGFAFAGFFICLALGIFLLALMKRLAVDPIHDFVATTPGIRVFDTAAYGVELPIRLVLIGGTVLTVAWVIAWLPTIFQHMAFMFSAARLWAFYCFWVSTIFDVLVNTRFFLGLFKPTGFAADFATYGVPGGIVVAIGYGAFSMLVAIVASIGTEFVAALAFAFAFALWPSVPWAVRSLLVGVSKGFISMGYGMRAISAEVSDYSRQRAAEEAPMVIEVSGPSRPQPQEPRRLEG